MTNIDGCGKSPPFEKLRVTGGIELWGPLPSFLVDNMVEPTDVGSVFAAINIESFMDLPEFTAAMDKALEEIRTSPRAAGVNRIYIPGEIEFEMKAERLANGIPIPEAVVRDFVALGHELAIPFPEA